MKYLVNAWKETSEIFTDQERAALAITEEVTLIQQNGLTDELMNLPRGFLARTKLLKSLWR
ncbi:carboxymuconolactone decarboxylase family protein [Sphingobacterium haloxyli]|uniref:Uncharacterized protein n=1 Tax=Sphingobacterium haloxyli TaxID=2100533 RepID=A0A2S9J042_9SPHI|nr:hypothetical protein [Sphingobacterium haloxyli]PRD46149.1 hypothetical protein C5745_17165 [Sphingobacterium haloxyli]